MPSLDMNRVVHVPQDNQYRCIHASLEMALRYVDEKVGVELSQGYLASILGEPTTFATCEQKLKALFEQDNRLCHLSVQHAAQEPRDHNNRRKLIWDGLERDCPVLLSLPVAFQGWVMASLEREYGRELAWCPLDGFHIRLCVRCDDSGVWMVDPGLDSKEQQVFVSWSTIQAAVTHPRADGNVVGGGDVLIVRSNTRG